MSPPLNKILGKIMATNDRVGKSKLRFYSDPVVEEMVKSERAANKTEQTLEKAILRTLNQGGEVERLAFEADPTHSNRYHSLYKAKTRLIPDKILKRIAIQDDLVASIVQVQCNHVAAFARPRPDRFSTGYVIEPLQSAIEAIEAIEDPKERKAKKEELQRRIQKVSNILLTCGEEGLDLGGNQDSLTFPQYTAMSIRNAVVVGRIATEVLYRGSGDDKRFAGFRVIDAGTIYRCEGQRDAVESVRRQARKLLANLRNDRLVPERYENDEYMWVQVIDDRPVQAFTADECLVHNFYPVPDIELDGYPVTPLDTVISAVTTHLNITSHNKLYFQSGRAARGMLVFRSDDVDEEIVSRVRQQFNAQINSVTNAWRMPVFGIGSEDEITWQPIDNGGRDMEFQYLMDMNARIIMSAFCISPEEMPGWSYLSRGTNSQALSECFPLSEKLLTANGYQSAEAMLAGRSAVDTMVWTGSRWQEAKLFRTGAKRLSRTLLYSGLSVETSPDHRFKTIGPDGDLIWKKQESLRSDDWVLVNKNPLPGCMEPPEYKGRKLTLDLAEVLGWMTGDGHLRQDGYRHGAQIKLFYHPERESGVQSKHLRILSEFGVSVKNTDRVFSEEERKLVAEQYGFKSTAERHLQNTVYDTDFYRWLSGLGFTPSTKELGGKSIPDFLFSLAPEYRAAFLRGFFSADGHVCKSGAIVLTVQNARVREGARKLLQSLGIRTLPCKGLEREGFGEKTFSFKLFVKDKLAFWELVGFVPELPHKANPKSATSDNWVLHDLPASVRDKYLRVCVDSPSFQNLSKSRRDRVRHILSGQSNCSSAFFRAVLETCGVTVPWMKEFNAERVFAAEQSEEFVEMADITVYDNSHEFNLGGFQVHNSNNEYRLEAARDVGIRPLLAHFEDFLNQTLLPKIDPYVAKLATIKLVGLDAETAEKESARLSQDLALHMTYDEVLSKVEKKALGRRLGGEFPLSPSYQSVLDKYLKVGFILEHLFDQEGASKDPQWDYVRDPFWFNWQQLLMQKEQMQQAAAQQQQAAAAQQQAAAQGGQAPPQDGGQQQPEARSAGEAFPQGEAAKPDRPTTSTEKQKSAALEESSASGSPQDLTRSIDQALVAVDLLSKSEKQLPPSKRVLLQKQKALIDDFMTRFKNDAEEAQKDILRLASSMQDKLG